MEIIFSMKHPDEVFNHFPNDKVCIDVLLDIGILRTDVKCLKCGQQMTIRNRGDQKQFRCRAIGAHDCSSRGIYADSPFRHSRVKPHQIIKMLVCCILNYSDDEMAAACGITNKLIGSSRMFCADFCASWLKSQGNYEILRLKQPTSNNGALSFDYSNTGVGAVLQSTNCNLQEMLDTSDIKTEIEEQPMLRSENIADLAPNPSASEVYLCPNCGQPNTNRQDQACEACSTANQGKLNEPSVEQPNESAAVPELMDKVGLMTIFADALNHRSVKLHESIKKLTKARTNRVNEGSEAEHGLKNIMQIVDDINTKTRAQMERMKELEEYCLAATACLQRRNQDQ